MRDPLPVWTGMDCVDGVHNEKCNKATMRVKQIHLLLVQSFEMHSGEISHIVNIESIAMTLNDCSGRYNKTPGKPRGTLLTQKKEHGDSINSD